MKGREDGVELLVGNRLLNLAKVGPPEKEQSLGQELNSEKNEEKEYESPCERRRLSREPRVSSMSLMTSPDRIPRFAKAPTVTTQLPTLTRAVAMDAPTKRKRL